MAAEVEFAPLASRDLDSILAHVAQDSSAAASRLVRRIYSRCLELGEFHERGVLLRTNMRRLVVGKYLIFYRVKPGSRVDSQCVQVVRILHGARSLPAAFRP